MKKITVFIFCLMALYTQAQNTFPTTGNVGIGTISPVSELDLGTSSSIPTIYPNKITLWQGGPNNYFGFGISTNTLDYFSQGNHRFFTEYNGTPGSEKMVIKSNGNVGIGTATPSEALDVTGNIKTSGSITIGSNGGKYTNGSIYGDADWGMIFRAATSSPKAANFMWANAANVELMRISNNGKVGIGTITPSEALDVTGNIKTSGSITIGSNGGKYTNGSIYGDADWGMIFRAATSSPRAANFMWANAANSELMRINNNGNVSIGTINSTYKLSVNGTIQAKEILVNTGWSDFVFDDNYKLRSLTEVEKFVKINKHLPQIPSQQEVEKNGVQLGNISSKLLMKIEELTLYMIQQKKEYQKEIEKQEAININLENQIRKLQNN